MSLNPIEREEIAAAHAFLDAEFPHAGAAFLGGAYVRDEGTPWSDLDIVVIESERARPGRMNLVIDGWFFDVIVHSPMSAFLAMQDEVLEGVPFTATLLAESVTLVESEIGETLLEEARSLVEAGPWPITSREVDELRFRITELVDDLREPRSMLELIGSAGELYDVFSNFVLRTRGEWPARGKWIARRIERIDPDFAHRFEYAFVRLSRHGHADDAIRIVEEILEPFGGFLYDGYHRGIAIAPDPIPRKISAAE